MLLPKHLLRALSGIEATVQIAQQNDDSMRRQCQAIWEQQRCCPESECTPLFSQLLELTGKLSGVNVAHFVRLISLSVERSRKNLRVFVTGMIRRKCLIEPNEFDSIVQPPLRATMPYYYGNVPQNELRELASSERGNLRKFL